MDITVLIADWAHLGEAAPDQRLDLLMDAAFPDEGWDVPDPECGWVWQSGTDAPWLARYVFRGTSGSYKAHFRTGQAWEKMRDAADADLRATLDRFLSGLFWYGPNPDDEATHVRGGLFAEKVGRGRGVLLSYPPDDMPVLVKSWVEAQPRIGELREPFDAHAVRPTEQWIRDFDEFADVLNCWGEVVGEADSRGWGLVGLPS
ncbi:hypothetical protein GCM10023322_80960 [Rugosimonospora acidiphila]|uniref:Uncharacterized protein n=2 Tax=Rugosimonospora acidiphila TaxID=556531 RepID=A0ABP9SUB3_9ACTN